MKKINMEQFLTLADNVIKNGGAINIDDGISPTLFFARILANCELVQFEVPKGVNRYDFIFEELKKKFEGRYSFISMHSFSGDYEISLVIDGQGFITFEYTSYDGQNWLYNLYKHV